MSDDCPKTRGCKWPACVGPHGGCNYWMMDELPGDIEAERIDAVALNQLRTQVAQMQEAAAECDALREKLSAILTGTANALKGEPAPLHSHSWHDLPEFAAAVSKISNEMIAKVVALEAERDDLREMYTAAHGSVSAALAQRDVASAKVALLRDELDGIRQYGSDTLSGRADGGPDDRNWQREAVLVMTNRARNALEETK